MIFFLSEYGFQEEKILKEKNVALPGKASTLNREGLNGGGDGGFIPTKNPARGLTIVMGLRATSYGGILAFSLVWNSLCADFKKIGQQNTHGLNRTLKGMVHLTNFDVSSALK